MEHDVTDYNRASCDDPLGERYSTGDVDGKSKAPYEVSTQTTDHPAGCVWAPRLAVSERLRHRAEQQGAADTGKYSERGGKARPETLRAELALILGIELSDGDLL